MRYFVAVTRGRMEFLGINIGDIPRSPYEFSVFARERNLYPDIDYIPIFPTDDDAQKRLDDLKREDIYTILTISGN